MIGVDVRSNIREVRAEFRAATNGVLNKAVPRALNRALDDASTEANRRIRDTYNVRAKALAAAMKKKRANVRSPAAILEVSGVRLGLIEFGAKQNRKGVSVRIKKGSSRDTIRHAFIATLKDGSNAGYRGVFVREGKERYPIKALRSIRLSQTFTNEAVMKAVNRVAEESFVRNFRQQIQFLSRR